MPRSKRPLLPRRSIDGAAMNEDQAKLEREFSQYFREVNALRRQPDPPAAFQRLAKAIVVKDTTMHIGGWG